MHKIKLNSAIKKIAYEYNSDKLAVLSEDGNFRILNSKLEVLSGFKTKIEQGHDLRQTAFMSNDLKLIAIAKPKTNKAVVLDIHNKKILYSIARNSGEIETVFINNTDKYLISGGIDGRTYIFNLQTGHFLYNLHSHPDYVTAITVTNTAQLVATGSFDGTITITNLNTLKNPIRFKSHHSYVCGIEFLNKGLMVSADKNGHIIIYDFVQRKVKKRLEKVPDDITKIKVDPNREFLFVATKLGRIFVYDLNKKELLTDNLRKYKSTITDMIITQTGELFVGLKNGSLYKEKLIDEEKYTELVTNQNYAALYAELERSPFVLYSQAYQNAERHWNQILSQAKELLSQKKSEEAKRILTPFAEIPKKKTVIRTLLSDFAEFEKFKNYVQNKKYFLAYPMTYKYTSFVDTKEYKMMEADWSKKFNKAQNIALDPRSDEIVRDLLKDFRGIPSKTKQIQQLLKDKVIFNMFKKQLDAKNYKGIFGFVRQYPFLKETDAYSHLTEFAHKCYEGLTEALSNLSFSKAKEYIEILENFEEYEDDIKDIHEEMTLLIQLVQYCKENNKAKIYEIIDNLNYEINLECVEKIQSEWDTVMDKAHILSFKGNINGLLELFTHYFDILTKSEIIKKYLISAYARKLEAAMKKATQKNEKVKNIIKDKIEQLNNKFGTIEEVRSLLYTFNEFYQDNLALLSVHPGTPLKKREYENLFATLL